MRANSDDRAKTPRLMAAKIAAGVLSLYAVVYSALLFIVLLASLGTMNFPGPLLVFFLLAATPFVAWIHLDRVSAPAEGRPLARPALLALVMSVPAVFWLYLGSDGILHRHRKIEDILVQFGAAILPGLLALYLSIVFLRLALRRAG